MIDYRDNVEVEDMDDRRLEEHSIHLVSLNRHLLTMMSDIHLARESVAILSHSFHSDGLRWALEDAAIGCCQFAYSLSCLVEEAKEEKKRRDEKKRKEAAK